MPIQIIEYLDKETIWGAWSISEETDELISLIGSGAMKESIPAFKQEARIRQWLSARALVKQLVEEIGGDFQGIDKDNFNKPWLIGSPWHISFAHTESWAVGVVHKSRAVGIDAEVPSTKIHSIRTRFLSANELEQTGDDLDMLCQYWCAKEALYKLYGKKQVDFRGELFIDRLPDGNLMGRIKKGDFELGVGLALKQIKEITIAVTKH